MMSQKYLGSPDDDEALHYYSKATMYQICHLVFHIPLANRPHFFSVSTYQSNLALNGDSTKGKIKLYKSISKCYSV